MQVTGIFFYENTKIVVKPFLLVKLKILFFKALTLHLQNKVCLRRRNQRKFCSLKMLQAISSNFVALFKIMNEESLNAEEITLSAVGTEQRLVYSAFLERDVVIDVYLPFKRFGQNGADLLLINDGQDLRTMDFNSLLDSLIASDSIEPLMCVGIHCGANRMQEYGTICSADYMGRGSLAGLYCRFVFDELLPFLQDEFNIASFRQKSFAGFSLGALSALDIVWNHADEFLKAGVFSGALWWRKRGYEDENYDWQKDRIMHAQVTNGTFKPSLQFFFECGRLDETADRNNNGIIDSVEDTTDLITELKKLGYKDEQFFYLELEDGRHDINTWKRAFPAFLLWGWGSSKKV